MALFKSQIVTQASGSVGGVTMSRAKGGMYLRARSMPVNPNSPYQAAVRAAQGLLAQRWQTTLTDVQRSGWEIYAANVSRKNRLGDVIHLSGIAMFTRCNVPRIQAGLSIVDDGPSNFTVGDPPTGLFVVFEEVEGENEMRVNYDALIPTTGSVLFYISRPISPTVRYFKGPFRYNGFASGAGGSKVVSAANLALPLTVGNDVVVRARAAYVDGRLSEPVEVRESISLDIPGGS